MNIPPNHPAILYSPGNWAVTAEAARSLCPGATFRVDVSGTDCALHFDMSALAGSPPQVAVAVDGGPVFVAPVAPVLEVPLPRSPASLELCFKSMGRGVSRYPGGGTTLVFTGLRASGVARPPARGPAVLVMGDSITEGVLAGDPTAATDTDQDDARRGYAYRLGALLDVEVGVIGYAGQGLTIAGDNDIPPFPAFFDQVVPGVPRAWQPEPALIVLNLGTNDAVKTRHRLRATRRLLPVLRTMLAATTATRIVVLQPFGGFLTPWLALAVILAASPRCTFLRTNGLLAAGDLLDGYHPSGAAGERIATALAARLRPLLPHSSGERGRR